MTNEELQTALSVMQHRINELDNLTEIVADLCGAVEDVLRSMRLTGPESADEYAWLKLKLQAAYRAGIPPRIRP